MPNILFSQRLSSYRLFLESIFLNPYIPKGIIFLIFIFSFTGTIAQTQTEKYNSYLERYEYFNTKGTMIGYKKYNSYLEQWEYTDVNSSNSSSSYYDNIPVYEPNYELINQVLSKKEAQYNSRMDATNGLVEEAANQLRLQFGSGTDEYRRAAKVFSALFDNGLNSITNDEGRVDVYNDEIFRRYKNIVISSFNEAVKAVHDEKPSRSHSELAIQYYNFGVKDQQNGNIQEAVRNYTKAIELNPNLSEAYTNMAALTLKEEKTIVQEMNRLSMSDSDSKRYDYLVNKRKNLFIKTKPFLEKAVEINPGNLEAKKLLQNINTQLAEIKVKENNKAVIQTTDVSNPLDKSNSDNILGGYKTTKIEEYEYNLITKKYDLKQTLNIDSELLFRKTDYYFKRGNLNWNSNLWSYAGYDSTNKLYQFFDTSGQRIIIDLDKTFILWYAENVNGVWKKIIKYSRLEQSSNVRPTNLRN